MMAASFLESSSSSSAQEAAKSEKSEQKDEEMEVDNVTDTDFLKSVLEQLPGVDTQNAEIQDALKSTATEDASKDKDKKKESKK